MPDPLPPAIEVDHLVKSYAGMTAVADLSFTVARGEIIGFLGPNGAGKSTTMRILTGYLPANSSTVRICGHSVATEPDAVKRLIGYMPENNPLPEDMRVSEYLYFRGRLKEIPAASSARASTRCSNSATSNASATKSSVSFPKATANASALPRPSSRSHP